MDLPWGEEESKRFITNVGLLTSDGPLGPNIMACEWTHHLSYSPGFVVVCVNPKDATHTNINATKEFGVGLASAKQTVLSSIAGGYSGKKVDKIKALKELGFKFYPARKIKPPMVQDAVLNLECKVVQEIPVGDHTMFVGEVQEISLNPEEEPIAYHLGKYGRVVHDIPKPSKEDREKFNTIVNQFLK
jgi:flavin reductase (DIM6/NTAB) family NADH-FMN oxidoreductase RutF